MTKPIKKKVSREEFEAFIANYPRPLARSHHYICTPTMVDYNDFTLGAWPYSSVAKTWINDQYPELHFEEEYYITVNHEELYAERRTE